MQIVLQKRKRNRKTPSLYEGNAGALQKKSRGVFLAQACLYCYICRIKERREACHAQN